MGADIGLLQGPALADRARRGDARAFAELYRREGPRAWRFAQAVTADAARAEDAVADAFAKVLTPPTPGLESHAPIDQQLLAATRDAAIERVARRAPEPDHPLPVQAFRRLPERWRSAMWLADVEGIDDDSIGSVLGLSTAATWALVARARAGLRERFVESHLARSGDAACRRAAEHLEAYANGNLGARAGGAVRRHLDGCERCRDRLAELDDLALGIRAAVTPLPPLTVFGATERAWAVAGLGAAGPLGITLRGRPVPAWAERAVAGAAAAVITLGITAAVVAGGRGNAKDPRLARQSTNEAPLHGGAGESALGGQVPLVVPNPPTTVPVPTASVVSASTTSSTAPVATSTTAPPAAPTVTTPQAAAPEPAPAAPAEPAPEPAAEEPLVEVKVGIEGLVGVSVGDKCTGISVLGTPLLCDPEAGTGLSLAGSLVGG
jgi:DNA-directed RNA polymerase specialized sigma24 family protein